MRADSLRNRFEVSSAGTYGTYVKNSRLPGMNVDMVYYADDTVLFSRDTKGINELLKWTETVSSTYGLKLNKDKCVAVAMNSDPNIHFHNNEPLKKEYETVYLGNEINKEVNITLEISNKLQEVRKTWFKLFPYWKTSGASKKWQIIVYDAVIRSKLLYGLETVQLTEAMYKKIDAFQLRGLRKILKMQTTFMNRANTNKKVYEAATQAAYARVEDHRQVKPFSEYHKQKKANLLGHILRADAEDPLRQVSFQPGTAYRVEYGKKRIGKPRQNWIHQTKSMFMLRSSIYFRIMKTGGKITRSTNMLCKGNSEGRWLRPRCRFTFFLTEGPLRLTVWRWKKSLH